MARQQGLMVVVTVAMLTIGMHAIAQGPFQRRVVCQSTLPCCSVQPMLVPTNSCSLPHAVSGSLESAEYARAVPVPPGARTVTVHMKYRYANPGADECDHEQDWEGAGSAAAACVEAESVLNGVLGPIYVCSCEEISSSVSSMAASTTLNLTPTTLSIAGKQIWCIARVKTLYRDRCGNCKLIFNAGSGHTPCEAERDAIKKMWRSTKDYGCVVSYCWCPTICKDLPR